MAQRRMISKSISTSTKLADVSNFSKLIFTWLIPHCDDFGRMDGSARLVKAIVVPLLPETVDEIEVSLKELTKAKLIQRYEVEGKQYLEIYKWYEHQTFKNDRPKRDIFPENPNGIEWNPNGKNVRLSEVKLSEVKLSEARSAGFDEFYKIYPRKVAKKKAQDAWKKIDPKIYPIIMAALKTQMVMDQWTKDDGRFIPHPTTWINQERWGDEVKTGATQKVVGKYGSVKTIKA